MYLGVNFLGLSFLRTVKLLPVETSFDIVKVFGAGVYDKLWIRNFREPKSYFENLKLENYKPTWTQDTVFLAEFQEDLEGGNMVLAEGEDVISWMINKRPKDSLVNQYLDTVPAEVTSYKDYQVRKGDGYIYQILPITQNTIGQPLETPNLISDYYGWFLIDEEDGLVFKFDINLVSGDLSSTDNQVEYETFNQFNTYSQGKRNFLKGQITGIVPESIPVDGVMEQSAEFMITLQDFVNNGKKKLLKSRKGDLWYVMTSGFARRQLSDSIEQQIETVTFNFVEIEKATGY